MKKRIKLKKLPFILIAILLIPLLAVTFYFKNDLKEDEVEEPPKVMETVKEIKIEHKNGLISIYQSLSDVYVKKGDPVSRGQLIGKSGTNELDKDLGNHLHFEIIENGNNVNPNNYLNKEYKKEN